MRRSSVTATGGLLLVFVLASCIGRDVGADAAAAAPAADQPAITSAAADSEGDSEPTTVESPATTAAPETTTTTEADPAEVLGLSLAPAERGDNGDHVVDLQTRLNDIGFTAGPPRRRLRSTDRTGRHRISDGRRARTDRYGQRGHHRRAVSVQLRRPGCDRR
ncbi:MAG: hypothetical protein OES24_03535 [Acidimicrobiia bacterium]|nr:hypothetical protein [Acidimicrobiia bacterium]